MFNSIRVAGYKSITELDLFKVPQILLVGGKNNAGKSSLLEAIFLALDRMNPDIVSRHFAWRGVTQYPLDPDYWWKPIFNNFDFSKAINVALQDSKSKSLELRIQHDPSYTSYNVMQPAGSFNIPQEKNSTQSASPVQALRITASYGGKQVQDSHLAMQAQGYIFQVHKAEGPTTLGVYISSSMRGSSKEDAVRYGQLDLKNMAAPLLDIARIIEPRIKGLSVVAMGEGAYIHAEVEGFPRKIPISMMGDGVTRILSVTLSILACENGVVLIDEVENGLHHSKLPALWAAIANACMASKCQIIATTHSYECLAAASKTLVELGKPTFSFARLDRVKSTGKIKAVQYSAEELSTALDAEFEVR